MKDQLDLYNFVKDHNIDQVLLIESEDPQYIAITSTYYKIQSNYSANIYQNNLLFLDLVIKISLITYQIGGTGEDWRKDVMNYIYICWANIDINKINDILWRNDLLQNTKYNRRLKNMKLARLRKIGNLREIFANLDDYEKAYLDMSTFHEKISNKLGANRFAKTPLFATKMFGYICRVIFDKLVIYPDGLSIPLDSRLKKIYIFLHNQNKTDDKIIIGFFDNLARNNKLSPLHLDSLLWLKYRKLNKN